MELTVRNTSRKYMLTGGKAAMAQALKDMSEDIKPLLVYTTLKPCKHFSGEKRCYIDNYIVQPFRSHTRLDRLELLFPRIQVISIDQIEEISMDQPDNLCIII